MEAKEAGLRPRDWVEAKEAGLRPRRLDEGQGGWVESGEAGWSQGRLGIIRIGIGAVPMASSRM